MSTFKSIKRKTGTTTIHSVHQQIFSLHCISSYHAVARDLRTRQPSAFSHLWRTRKRKLSSWVSIPTSSGNDHHS